MSESHQAVLQVTYDDETNLRELFRALWVGKWLIGSIIFAATVISVIVALMLPNIYRAEALLTPNDQEGAGELSALAAQYGGLASLAGINLRGGRADKMTLGLEVLKSRKFISDFIARRDILVPLIAAKGWNPESGILEIDPDDYDAVSGKWTRNVSAPKKIIPSSQEAYEEFKKILSVNLDKNTGFVTVAVEHYSPTVAKQWVDWLIDDLNSSIMLQDVAEAERSIEYLKKQIESTSLADLQHVFFRLIEEQTKTVMLAKVSDEYLLKTLDPAVAPEMRSKPNRRLIVVLGMMLGGFFGIMLVSLLNWQRRPDYRPDFDDANVGNRPVA